MSETLKFGNGLWAKKEGSTLAFNDENGNYKPLPFNFERAGSATRVNKQGLIEVVSNNEPRIDFNNNSKGALLLEPTRTNIFDYSSDLSSWSKLNSTVTESSVLSLDGINNSYAYERTSSSSSYIYRTVSLSNTTDYTLSFFVKSGTSTNVRTDIWDTTQSVQCEIQIDLVTKTVSNFSGSSYKIEDYTNGWMRIYVTFTSESNFGTTFNRYFNADSVGSELYIWGAQLEQGSYATSYIPTSGSIGTRDAESCTNSGNDQVINSTEGVLYAEISALNSTASSSQYISISDGTYNNRASILFSSGSVNAIRTFLRVGGAVQIDVNNSVADVTDFNKIAFSYKENDFKVYINGSLASSDTSGSVWSTNTITKLSFSEINTSTNKFEGNVKDVKIYNTALTDQELIALTS